MKNVLGVFGGICTEGFEEQGRVKFHQKKSALEFQKFCLTREDAK